MGGLFARVADPQAWLRSLGLALAMGAFFALIGPFGSFNLPFPRRLVISMTYSLGGMVVWGPGLPVLIQLADRIGLPAILGRAAAALIVCIPVTLVIRVISRLFSEGEGPSLPALYVDIVSMAFPLSLGHYAIQLWAARRTAEAPTTSAPARLLARLPAAVEGEILALRAEDHYVRVHTVRGSALILMRMADAVAELDGLAGLQVHRSWWVARTAVTGAAPAGRRANLVLSNGLTVPVSRAAMPQARASGFLGVRA